ncbi:putative membrane protein YphA (DoxX/SURF4 family) [Flavobacterium sp. 2755]|uniref:MauE/DoxX family redox-associated membrane protein n=1 Tax=Flavobacterium sp. 2755 TaxID=2817765 RepID=UPI0028622841|nr:MauE/DoxX family redox-associated membrane protein [Flavobacterium sp. 2755]MDR6761905.1 putative membrane protein YphA (DoxX/SURF4 family) [Flavobacterium sp. 2755]
MKTKTSCKKIIVEIICILFVLLFVYAAVSKILEFEKFRVQLGQSPLLSVHAGWISWCVIAGELLTASLLFLPRFRTAALLVSLGIMAMFSAYIFIILNFSSFVPCSCGGILEKMSWDTHLVFNLFFVVLAALGAVLNIHLQANLPYRIAVRKTLLMEAGIAAAGIFIVVALYLTSEKMMHQNNPFLRRYPQHPIEFVHSVDLKHNSHYIAGSSVNKIYLGNYEYPTYILSIGQNLKSRKLEKIHYDVDKFPFKMITVTVKGGYFYLSDGIVPVLLRGDVKSWKATKELQGIPHFTSAVPIDTAKAVFRSNNSKNLANVLGIFNSDSVHKTAYKRELLQAQGDGIFDTDGILLYSSETGKIIYLYYYRNEFFTADKNGRLLSRGHTIDTISRVKFKVSKLDKGRQYTISSPSLVVNANAAVYRNLLFVHSTVKGRYENEKLWQKSFIIDVYDLNTNTYRFSFPLYHTISNVLNSFIVDNNRLYAVIGTDLAVYQLKDILKKEFK